MEIPLHLTFVPGLIMAIGIRFDAKAIGPYFATSEFIPGLPGFQAKFWYTPRVIKFAIVRRLAYPFIIGLILGFLGENILTASIAGAIGGFLLIWPAFFMTPQPGALRHDKRYIAINAGIVALSTGLATLGVLATQAIEAFSDGDILAWLAENAFTAVMTTVLNLIFFAFVKGAAARARGEIEDV
ncbi:hypothetical protein MN0502_02120 [Arthrobacter sp. MN05-02]|nr:hypothetical protein MN0502_02120 [Arthrobacter sp. MN05-02]